ncbi:MAG: TonB-dependent receptor [Myxococcales bacterium]|nr:TonB-dependent receptor [Myxococcales bacterium]
MAEGPDDLAAPGPATAEDVVRLAPVEVSARRIRDNPQDPTSYTTVIEPKQFESQFRTVPDLLSREAGLNVRQFGGLGQLSTVSIRGSSAEQVLILLDGVRLNSSNLGGVDLSTIPLESIERIEVTRGGGAAIYGSDAVGGVINIITKKPSRALGGSGSFSYGSFDTLKQEASISGAAGDHELLLSQIHFQSDGDFTFSEQSFEDENGVPIVDPANPPKKNARRRNNDFTSESVLAKYVWRPSSRFHVTAVDDFFRTERGQPGFASVEDRQLLHARQEVRRNIASVAADATGLAGDALDLHLDLSHRIERIDFTDTMPSLGVGTIDTTTADQSLAARLRVGYYASLLDGSPFEMHHYLTVSGEARYDYFTDTVRNPAQAEFPYIDRSTFAVMLQDEVTFWRDRLSVIPSYRFDATDFGDAHNGKIGLAFRPADWVTLKGNYETTFRQPNFSELFFPDQGFIRGNPDLRPEEGRAWDVGVSLQFRRVFAEVVYFGSDVDNQIFFVPISPFTVAPVNTGRIDIDGVEVSAEVVPFDWLVLSGNFTHQRVITRETGKQLATRPENTANGRATFRNRYGELYAEMQFIDDIPLDSIGAVFVVRRTQWDVGATLNLLAMLDGTAVARHLSKFTLGVDVKNVTDDDFADARGAPLPGLSVFGKIYVAF